VKISISRNRLLLGLGSILIIAFLLSKVNIKELFSTLGSLKWEYGLLAALLYLVGYLVRILRLIIVLGRRSLWKWFQFTGIFQLLNRTLPFRSGEVFFPILLKKMFAISYAETVPQLLIIRILDLLTLFLAFIGTLLWLEVGDFLQLTIIALLSIGTLALLYRYRNQLIDFLFALAIRFFPKFDQQLTDIQEKINQALSISTFQLLSLVFLSILDKIVNFSCLVIVVFGLGFTIPLAELLAAIGLSGFSEILPINSIGSFGTLELGWVGALTYFGIDLDIAIKSGFASHLVVFGITLLIGTICSITYLYSERN